MTKLFKFIIFFTSILCCPFSMIFLRMTDLDLLYKVVSLLYMYMYKGRTDGWIVVSVPIPWQNRDRPGKGGIRHSHLWQSPGKFIRKVSITLCTYTTGYFFITCNRIPHKGMIFDGHIFFSQGISIGLFLISAFLYLFMQDKDWAIYLILWKLRAGKIDAYKV